MKENGRRERLGKGRGYAHCNVDVFHSHLAVYFFHSFAGILHGNEGFLVDICGFDGVDLLFEHGNLAGGLLEGVLMLLLAFEGVACSCRHKNGIVSFHNSSRVILETACYGLVDLRCNSSGVGAAYRSYLS